MALPLNYYEYVYRHSRNEVEAVILLWPMIVIAIGAFTQHLRIRWPQTLRVHHIH